jgi:hypothetical protein
MLPMTPRGHMGARPWTDKQFSAEHRAKPLRYSSCRKALPRHPWHDAAMQLSILRRRTGICPPFTTLLKEMTEPFGHLTERLASA